MICEDIVVIVDNITVTISLFVLGKSVSKVLRPEDLKQCSVLNPCSNQLESKDQL